MNPDTGQLYPSWHAAKEDGVDNPVELTGRPEDIQRIASAVAQGRHRKQAQKRRKMAKASRKANRT